jgi:hypothetical protein
MDRKRWLPAVVAAWIGVAAFFAVVSDASALPAFARKYQTSCLTCHTVYPVLNPFGEAFRRDGYRFPSQNGSVDSDAEKAPTIALGQEEYTKTFPNSVWPANIPESVPLSVMIRGTVGVNVPNSDAHADEGQTFTWKNIVNEFHILGAGAFNNSLTYFMHVFATTSGTIDVRSAYLLWNDIIGLRHLVNLWVGRLQGPQLTSFGSRSSYLTTSLMPLGSIAGLYNASATFALGQGDTEGAELSGVAGHRFGYSLGWIASGASPGLTVPNSEDVYAHVGVKMGGVALDGEGRYGPNVPDPKKPWAEKALTADAYGYHGLTTADNGTGVIGGATTAIGQGDRVNAFGGSIRAQYESFILTAGAQYEHHLAPYAGTEGTMGVNGATFPGVPNYDRGTGVVQYNEIAYIIWPWLVPAVRSEYTRVSVTNSSPASLFRFLPGIAMLARPNIKVVVAAEFDMAYGMPPSGSWSAANGFVVAPGRAQYSKIEAEQINATMSFAY